jgi:hypothetical protein
MCRIFLIRLFGLDYNQSCFGGIRGYTLYVHLSIFKVACTHLQKVGARAYAYFYFLWEKGRIFCSKPLAITTGYNASLSY